MEMEGSGDYGVERQLLEYQTTRSQSNSFVSLDCPSPNPLSSARDLPLGI